MPGHAGEDRRGGFFLASSQTFDLVLLDLMLPHKDGIEVLRTLRQCGRDTPVLILTARDASVASPESGRFRFLSGEELLGSVSVLVRAGRTEAPVYESLRKLLLVLALGIPVAVGAAALGGYALARRALRPVDQMASQARSITADQLGRRPPVSNAYDEFGRLAAVFNETFCFGFSTGDPNRI